MSLPSSLVWLLPVLITAALIVPEPELSLCIALLAAFGAMNMFAFSLPRGDVICMQGGVAVAATGLVSPLVATTAILGAALAVGPQTRDSELSRPLFVTVARAGLMGLTALAYRALLLNAAPYTLFVSIATLALAGTAFMLGDLMLYGLAYSGRQSPFGLRAGESLLRVLGAGYTAQVTVGIALVMVYPRLDLMAFVVLVPLMAIMQHTTGMLLSVRSAYMRTIGALARVAEMQAGGTPGHAERVSVIAAQVGRRMRLDSGQMERLALAALLHDIGRLRDADAQSWERLAEAGAEVLAKISFLSSIAPILSKMPMDYRSFIDTQEADGRLARIVRIASDYDDLSSTRSPVAGTVEIKMRSQGDYDPDILNEVLALTNLGAG